MNTKRYCTDDDLNNPQGADCMVRDGQRVRVSMLMRDSAPCGCEGVPLADSASTVQGQTATTLERMQDNADRVQAHVDHHRETAEQRRRAIDADPRSRAYDDMCADLQSGGVR